MYVEKLLVTIMSESLMSPKTRRLIQVCPTDEEETYKMFDTLLGDNIEARKEFISTHGALYIKDADI